MWRVRWVENPCMKDVTLTHELTMKLNELRIELSGCSAALTRQNPARLKVSKVSRITEFTEV
jgi:hypothetical protein